MYGAPTSSAIFANFMSSLVSVVCAPTVTGTLPSAASTTAHATSLRSSKDSVEKSPAAPAASIIPLPFFTP